MDDLFEEGKEFNLKNLTNLASYKSLQPTRMELDPQATLF